MRQLGIAALIAVLLMIGGFGFGAFITSNHYQKKIAEFKADAERQYAQALEAKSVREQYLQSKANDAAAKAKRDQDEILSDYRALRAAAGDLADRLHERSAGGEAGMPGAAAAAVGVSGSAYGRASADGAKLQRLYERQLEIARDCDITAAHYNELIRLWSETVTDNADKK